MDPAHHPLTGRGPEEGLSYCVRAAPEVGVGVKFEQSLQPWGVEKCLPSLKLSFEYCDLVFISKCIKASPNSQRPFHPSSTFT